MQTYTHIIWDWNGTLLDDIAWSMRSINAMLKQRGLPTLNSVLAYQNVFGFPIIDYYRRVGFDFEKESFVKLAAEYIELYYAPASDASLFPQARDILAGFQDRGIRQIILSASETKNLLAQVGPFDIEKYFDEILGISDIYATSKIDSGKSYIERMKPERAVLIGDTIHDKEVADTLDIDCILIARGHQSEETLRSCGATVADCLTDVKNLIGGSSSSNELRRKT